MNTSSYRLLMLHSRLDGEVRREQQQRFPNVWRLLRLKKLKLAIKDRLHRLATVSNIGVV